MNMHRKANAKAVDLMRECVRLRQRILGTGHPNSVSSSNTLAKWEAEQGELTASHKQ